MNDHDHDIGLGRCMVKPDEHGPAIGVVGIEHQLTKERRLVFLCGACVMAHTTAELARVVFGPGLLSLINLLFVRIGVTEQVGIEMIEVALETHPTGDHIEALRDLLRQLRAGLDDSLTPIDANDFARLMAATPVNTPKREEIN